MSLWNLVIVIVLSLALMGMFFWTLTLHNRQEELGGASASDSAPQDPEREKRVASLEGTVKELDVLIRSQMGDMTRVQGRLDDIEKLDEAQNQKINALASGAPVVSSGATGSDDGLRNAIQAVLTEKEEADRKARAERMARGMARFMLAEIDATQEQQDGFTKAIVTYLDGRERIRSEYSDDEQRRTAEMERLTQDRNDAIQALFSGDDYTKIEQRLNRGRRWTEGRRGGNRTPPGGSGVRPR